MYKSNSSKTFVLCFGVLVMIFLLNYLVLAWIEPSASPPNNNVPAPLNVGNTGQSKSGGLILNTGGAATGLVVVNGNVGIGITNPAYKLDVSGQIHATGDICTDVGGGKCLSSAGGGSQWTTSGSNIYYNLGNVGIGTNSPSQKLEVKGSGLFTGDVCNGAGACLSMLNDFIGSRPLVNNRHNYAACTGASGTVVPSDVSYPMCRFNAASCPGGWTQYKGYNAADGSYTTSCSTFSLSDMRGYTRCFETGRGCRAYYTFSPMAWGDNGLPCVMAECYCGGQCGTCNCQVCRAASTITQIGCY